MSQCFKLAAHVKLCLTWAANEWQRCHHHQSTNGWMDMM